MKLAENKKPPNSTKRGNEGIQRSGTKQMPRAGLILLFVGEASRVSGTDERNQTGILTSGLNPRSRLPDRERSVAHGSLYPVTVAQPPPNFTGFPSHLIATKQAARIHFGFELVRERLSSFKERAQY